MQLLCDLSQVEVEVDDRVVKKFLNRHEVTEVGIPLGGIVHPAFPLIIFDRVDFLHQGEIDPVIYLANPLIRKYPSLQTSAKSVNPVERRGESIQNPREDFGSPFGEMTP